MTLQRTIHAAIRAGEESGYVAECSELHAVTQGSTLDEVAANLREVVALALEDEDLESMGLVPSRVIVVSMSWSPQLPRLRRLSGTEVVRILGEFGFRPSGSAAATSNSGASWMGDSKRFTSQCTGNSTSVRRGQSSARRRSMFRSRSWGDTS